jgi:hypothetical protein
MFRWNNRIVSTGNRMKTITAILTASEAVWVPTRMKDIRKGTTKEFYCTHL